MAGFLLPAEAASSSSAPNELQQMQIEEPPPSQFIVKESAFGSVESSPPLVQIPIVDVSLVFSSQDELEKLKNALSSWGCFQAIGHGISSSFLDKVREAAEHFFSLPMEEKHKCFRAVKEAEGYGSDLIVSDKQILDWSNRLFLMVFPENQRRLNLWPEMPNDFGEILIEYATKIRSLMDLCFKAMAKSLQLEEDIFLKHFGDQAVVQARYNFYPPCPRSDLVLGLKSHSDKSGVTILLQDQQVEGLQLFKDGTWFRVPIIPQALIVNLGDQMEVKNKSMRNNGDSNPFTIYQNLKTFHISVLQENCHARPICMRLDTENQIGSRARRIEVESCLQQGLVSKQLLCKAILF